MFSHLHGFSISWIDAIGMDPRYPPTEGWPRLVEQWMDSIKEPVFGVGHSLGGYLNYLAAVRRPELFRAIVLLDAPIIGPFRGSMLGATKRLGIVDRVTPAGATRDRRSCLYSPHVPAPTQRTNRRAPAYARIGNDQGPARQRSVTFGTDPLTGEVQVVTSPS